MAARAIGGDAIRAGQHRGGQVGHGGRVGAHIGALVVEELVIDGEHLAIRIDGGAHPMALGT